MTPTSWRGGNAPPSTARRGCEVLRDRAGGPGRPPPASIASGHGDGSEMAAVLAASGGRVHRRPRARRLRAAVPDPLWPALAGGLVLVNTAFSGPPLGAFRAAGRGLHRRLDLVVIGVLVLLAALPMLTIDAASRLTMVIIAVVLAVVWWGTNFADSAERRRRRLATSAFRSGRRPEHRPDRRPARRQGRRGDAQARLGDC